jgi:hypothetical protein
MEQSMQRGSFIECVVCEAQEQFREVPQGSWLRVDVEGRNGLVLNLKGKRHMPPFYCCSAEHLKMLVNSQPFQTAARERESA